MVDQLRTKADETTIPVVVGDMAGGAADGTFTLVHLVFNAIANLLTQEEDTYDVLRQQVVSHHLLFSDGRQAGLFRTPHRYIWPAELDLMAQLAGFELETRHADWVGSDFTAASPSHVSVYRLPLSR